MAPDEGHQVFSFSVEQTMKLEFWAKIEIWAWRSLAFACSEVRKEEERRSYFLWFPSILFWHSVQQLSMQKLVMNALINPKPPNTIPIYRLKHSNKDSLDCASWNVFFFEVWLHQCLCSFRLGALPTAYKNARHKPNIRSFILSVVLGFG